MRRGLLSFLIGGLIWIAAIVEHFLGLIQSLDFVKTKAPEIYRAITSPTFNTAIIAVGLIFVIAGVRQLLQQKKNGSRPQRESAKRGNSVNLTGNTGTTIAGRDVIINGLLPGSTSSDSKPTVIQKPAPDLKPLGIRKKQIPYPFRAQYRSSWEHHAYDAYCIAVRNDSDSVAKSARNVVAHLEFESDVEGPISIDAAWWVEDANDQGYPLNISNSDTKHLVLVVCRGDGACISLSKIWQTRSHRHLPEPADQLRVGAWRVILELKAERFRGKYYIDGTVSQEGDCSWSKPLTDRPSHWPPDRD